MYRTQLYVLNRSKVFVEKIKFSEKIENKSQPLVMLPFVK